MGTHDIYDFFKKKLNSRKINKNEKNIKFF